MAETRVEVLQKIYQWVDIEDKGCIFWLSGLAGTGKSAIARTVARNYKEQGHLAASFFFSRGGGDSSHAGLFVTSIARQLADSPMLKVGKHIRDAWIQRSHIAGQTLRDQWMQLVIHPLSMRNKTTSSNAFLLVIDALDECDDDANISTVLSLLARVGDLVNVRVRVLITSRRETQIRNGFHDIEATIHHEFVLHHIPPEVSDRDILVFLKYHLQAIARRRDLPNTWPGENTLALMVKHAERLFIWAETARRFISDGKSQKFTRQRLALLLDRSKSDLVGPEVELDKIYTTVLTSSLPTDVVEGEREEACNDLRLILGGIVILFTTVSIHTLSILLALPENEVFQSIAELHSILDIPQNPTHHLRLHHDSFRNFLLSEKRCQEPGLRVDEKQAHMALTNNCIQIMSSVLREDIFNLSAAGILVTDLSNDYIQQYLAPEAQYSCLYWASHCARSEQQLTDDNAVHEFLRKHILHWIEAMSWMGKTSEAIQVLSSLEAMTKVLSFAPIWDFVMISTGPLG